MPCASIRWWATRAIAACSARWSWSATRPRTPFDPAVKLPTRLFDAAGRNGIVLRAFGDGTLGFAPALCLSESECEELLARVKRVLDEVLDETEVRAALRGGLMA